MSAACALAEAGFRVQLVERRGYLGGRASSYLHPGVNEVIDNCQHVLFGCCTNLIGFYRRIGVADRIHWTSEMTMIEPGGRRSPLGPSWLPAPLHGLPKLLSAHAFSFADKLSLARAFRALMQPVPADSTENLGAWLAAQRADKRSNRAILAARHCQRAQCGPRFHRFTLRCESHSRTIHELRAGGQHGHEHSPAQRPLRQCGRIPPAPRLCALPQHQCRIRGVG